jgi:transposase-like protein
MEKKPRRRFTNEEKVVVLKRHLINGEKVSAICEELQVKPNVFYKWQQALFLNGVKAFESPINRAEQRESDRMLKLKEKLVEKDGVISELVTELIKLKKNDGDL